MATKAKDTKASESKANADKTTEAHSLEEQAAQQTTLNKQNLALAGPTWPYLAELILPQPSQLPDRIRSKTLACEFSHTISPTEF